MDGRLRDFFFVCLFPHHGKDVVVFDLTGLGVVHGHHGLVLLVLFVSGLVGHGPSVSCKNTILQNSSTGTNVYIYVSRDVHRWIGWLIDIQDLWPGWYPFVTI